MIKLKAEQLASVMEKVFKHFSSELQQGIFHDYIQETLKNELNKNTEKKNPAWFKFIDNTIKHGLQEMDENSVIANVIRFETFLFDIMKLVLTHDRKLIIKKCGDAKDFELDRKELTLILSELLDEKCFNDRIDSIIKNRLNKLVSPTHYFAYFTCITGIVIDEELLQKYYEIKATRDLIVHHNKVIDSDYLRKSGKLARGKINELILIDTKYVNFIPKTISEIIYFIGDEFAGQMDEDERKKFEAMDIEFLVE